jgi:hypothetical protein
MHMRLSRGPGRLVAGGALAVGICAVAAAIAAACGGTSGYPLAVQTQPAQVDPGSGPFDCSVSDPYSFYMIEDFASGAMTGWYTNNEVCYPCQTGTDQCLETGTWDVWLGGAATCSASALSSCIAQCLAVQPSPPYSADPMPATLIPNGGRCGSLYALQVLAGPFINWGGSVGRKLIAPCPDGGGDEGICGFDASSYDGIAVWMRTAPGYANTPRFTVTDKYTDTSYNQLLINQGLTPYCNPNPPAQNPIAGCDKFGSYADLTENWQLFLMPFSEMREAGWGRQEPQLDTSGIMSIEIDFAQGSWDFWVSNVAFYRLNSQ